MSSENTIIFRELIQNIDGKKLNELFNGFGSYSKRVYSFKDSELELTFGEVKTKLKYILIDLFQSLLPTLTKTEKYFICVYSNHKDIHTLKWNLDSHEKRFYLFNSLSEDYIISTINKRRLLL